jgi:hypothetical protein
MGFYSGFRYLYFVSEIDKAAFFSVQIMEYCIRLSLAGCTFGMLQQYPDDDMPEEPISFSPNPITKA